jgi:hypothetical protein
MDIIRECEERKKEGTSMIAAMGKWQRKHPKKKVPDNFLKDKQTCTISAFISEVIKCRFDAKYLRGRKLTSQVAKHGEVLKGLCIRMTSMPSQILFLFIFFSSMYVQFLSVVCFTDLVYCA